MFVTIEGIIGAGKSTVLRWLKERAQGPTKIIEEPVEKWVRTGQLGKFYEDPAKYAYSFQQEVLKSFETNEVTGDLIVRERSPFSSFYVFAAIQHALSNISISEFNRLEKRLGTILKDYDTPHLIIYLQVDRNIATERIRLRNRSGENLLREGYMKEVEALHDNIFVENKGVFKIPVVTIDANRQIEEIVEEVEKTIEIYRVKTWSDQDKLLRLQIRVNPLNRTVPWRKRKFPVYILEGLPATKKDQHLELLRKENADLNIIVKPLGFQQLEDITLDNLKAALVDHSLVVEPEAPTIIADSVHSVFLIYGGLARFYGQISEEEYLELEELYEDMLLLHEPITAMIYVKWPLCRDYMGLRMATNRYYGNLYRELKSHFSIP